MTVIIVKERRRYGCIAFLFDIFMCLLTAVIFGGFPAWIIWIIVREIWKSR